MTALAADKIVKTRENRTPSVDRFAIVDGEQIHLGSLVNVVSASGKAKAAEDEAGAFCAGIAVGFEGDNADGLGVTAGTEYVVVHYGHQALVNVAADIDAITNLDLNVFVADDQTVQGATAATNDVAVGRLVKFEASDFTTAWVELRTFGQTDTA